MLPSSSSQPQKGPAPVPGNGDSGNWPLVLAGALILYTAGAGWGLFSGNIPAQRSFILMALPCLLPLAWCAYGYFKGDDKDQGLLLSAIGWLLILGSLIAKDIAVMGTPAATNASQASSPLVPICAAFGVLCLLIGAGASWMFWASREERRASQQRHSTHY